MEVICLILFLDIPYLAATREVIDKYACPSATNSAACATLNSVSCLVALFDITPIYTKKIGKGYNKSFAINTVLQLLGGSIASP